MTYEKIAQTIKAQDGAIFGDTLFRFNHRGEGKAYAIPDLLSGNYLEEPAPCKDFFLDGKEYLCPHCNAVFFGKEFFAPEDSFPILYANVYNNYAKEENRLEGTLLAYRLTETNGEIQTKLVQIIRIGFVNTPLWRSSTEDKRPYGNFVYLPEKDRLVAFVMRDAAKDSRFFSFAMPSVFSGKPNVMGIPEVVLHEKDLLSSFDGPQLFYIQGATAHKGNIYSTEGFGEREGEISAIRIFDAESGKEKAYHNLVKLGLPIEPEWIDFWGDTCFYSGADGILYRLEF